MAVIEKTQAQKGPQAPREWPRETAVGVANCREEKSSC